MSESSISHGPVGRSPLTKRVCVVTGASSGIGRRTSLDLAARGAHVCLVARREDRLAALLEELGGEARGHSYFVADVSDRAAVQGLAQHVRSRYGRLDVLVNNAGFSAGEGMRGPESIDEIREVMETNFFGAVNCTGELFELLKRATPSHVVNVASMAGRLAAPGNSTYAASKFALVGWTEALHPEMAKKGIYFSSVEPGFIPTEGFPQKNLVGDRYLRYILGTEEQVSEAILDAIAGRKPQRVVPRWYYLLQIPRLLMPGLYRIILKKLMGTEAAKKAADFTA